MAEAQDKLQADVVLAKERLASEIQKRDEQIQELRGLLQEGGNESESASQPQTLEDLLGGGDNGELGRKLSITLEKAKERQGQAKQVIAKHEDRCEKMKSSLVHLIMLMPM